MDPLENEDEWFTLEGIVPVENDERLYCVAVDSPDKQFLVGELGVPTHNTEDGKAEDGLKGEAQQIIGSIARLGRAAGVHLVIATQRPDASILPGELKANLGVRINCGRTDSNASGMILGNAEGTRVRAHPRGRLYLRIYGAGDHAQGFFAEQEWIDNYLAEKGLNPDGSPLSTHRSQLANIVDLSQFEGTDLDSHEGIDNSAVIEEIRRREAEGIFEDGDGDDDLANESWGLEPDDDYSEDVDEGDAAAEDPYAAEVEAGLRPKFAPKTVDDHDKWHRPEDDWDDDWDSLIEENRN